MGCSGSFRILLVLLNRCAWLLYAFAASSLFLWIAHIKPSCQICHTTDKQYTYKPRLQYGRVSNRKSRSMQNEFISVVSCRPTLGKIETTPQIGYALGKVHDNAILNHMCKYKKKGYVTNTMRIGQEH